MTPSYLSSEEALNRIYETIPDAKLIILVREPVDRLYSHYQLLKANWNTTHTFEERIEYEPSLLQEGFYIDYINKFRIFR